MAMAIKRFDVNLVNLDPTVGSEIHKTRACLIISPDEMNRSISTVMIAPMTTKSRSYPTRIPVTLKRTKGWIVLDQIRTVDKVRLIKKLGTIKPRTMQSVKSCIKEMLVD